MATSAASMPPAGHHHSRGSSRRPRLTLMLTAMVALLHGLAGAAPELLVFDRAAIADGELWRLVSAHWVHSDSEHLAWNVAGLLVLGWLFEPLLRARLLTVLLVGTLGVDLLIWWMLPELERYCGLSGILNALLAAGLYLMWRTSRAPLVILTGLGALAKIAVEVSSASALFTHSAWPSVPGAHAAGFAAGLLYWLLIRSISSATDSENTFVKDNSCAFGRGTGAVGES
jgi:rhomboid family GlyGly-CTERM serine protease